MIDRAAIHALVAELWQRLAGRAAASAHTQLRRMVLRAFAARALEPAEPTRSLVGLATGVFERATSALPALLPLADHLALSTAPAELELPAVDGSGDLAMLLGAVYEALLEVGERRRAGAHHTEPALADDVVARTLQPLRLDSSAELACCDPAMGSGVFLARAAAQLGARARLYGIDHDPIAVALAKLALFANSDRSAATASQIDRRLVCADFTLRADAGSYGVTGTPFVLASAFPEIAARSGFDAVIGNPPWVAFAGRAAQPIEPARARYFRDTVNAFAKYTTLHGVFVERAAELVRPGGRLGLLVPTSMADLAGYGPARAGHDRYAIVDGELPDYGAQAFTGVFQPAMAILSTRRAEPVEPARVEWALESEFAHGAVAILLARLRALPLFSAETFGERGYQTTAADRMTLKKKPFGTSREPLRCGGDVSPFCRLPASYFVDPNELGSRLRPLSGYADVALLIRQTARFPIACFADGQRFRNSVLAGFAGSDCSRGLLLAYLNSTPLRYYHYARFRDARQGMPQLKISHLRSLPRPPMLCEAGPERRALEALGEELGLRNQGLRPSEQAEIDRIVALALELTPAELELMAAWQHGRGALPVPRRR